MQKQSHLFAQLTDMWD